MKNLTRACALLGAVTITTVRVLAAVSAWLWRRIYRAFTDELPPTSAVDGEWFDGHLDMREEMGELEAHRKLMARPLWIGTAVATVGIIVGIAWVQSAPGLGEPHPDSIVDTGETAITVAPPNPFTIAAYE